MPNAMIWRSLAVAVVASSISANVSRAQTPQGKSGNCEMRLLHAPKPVYPHDSGHEKRVLKSATVVELVVKDDGSIKTIGLRRSCGIRIYDQAIIRALKKWRYNEAKGCGQRRATVTVNINPLVDEAATQ